LGAVRRAGADRDPGQGTRRRSQHSSRQQYAYDLKPSTTLFICRRIAATTMRGPAIILFALTAASGVIAQAIPGASPDSTAGLSRGEWPAYAGTYASARYSPLTQIDHTNAKDLGVTWRWRSPGHAVKDGNPRSGPTRANESTPVTLRTFFSGPDARSPGPVS
jgi:glucose dehydrogenase